jgi:hypothetical protein
LIPFRFGNGKLWHWRPDHGHKKSWKTNQSLALVNAEDRREDVQLESRGLTIRNNTEPSFFELGNHEFFREGTRVTIGQRKEIQCDLALTKSLDVQLGNGTLQRPDQQALFET